MPAQKVNVLFDQYNILEFIEDCYSVFHMEGDYSVFGDIKTVLKNCAAAGKPAAVFLLLCIWENRRTESIFTQRQALQTLK